MALPPPITDTKLLLQPDLVKNDLVTCKFSYSTNQENTITVEKGGGRGRGPPPTKFTSSLSFSSFAAYTPASTSTAPLSASSSFGSRANQSSGPRKGFLTTRTKIVDTEEDLVPVPATARSCAPSAPSTPSSPIHPSSKSKPIPGGLRPSLSLSSFPSSPPSPSAPSSFHTSPPSSSSMLSSSVSMCSFLEGDNDSIVNNKKQTRTVLENFLRTKRPDIAELIARGILSTEGNIEGITFAKKNYFGDKTELIGMPLNELLEAVPGRDIPFLVDQCLTYIRRNAMTLHGVFRVSPNQAELCRLRALYKSPLEVIDLERKVKDPHVVAGLLKTFLSSLPEPLFPFTLYEPLITSFERLFDQENPKPLIAEYKILLRLIPKAQSHLVQFLFQFLFDLQKNSEKNMMTPTNLGIVFGPNLIKPEKQTQDTMLNMSNRDVVAFLVTHYSELWG